MKQQITEIDISDLPDRLKEIFIDKFQHITALEDMAIEAKENAKKELASAESERKDLEKLTDWLKSDTDHFEDLILRWENKIFLGFLFCCLNIVFLLLNVAIMYKSIK